MEGVGARLGRSSSRYGTTTVFNGPVRKWKKDWVPINPPPSSNHHHHVGSSSSSSNGSLVNGVSGSNTVSHLRLYKWTPLNNSNPTSNNKLSPNTLAKNDDDTLVNPSKDSANDHVVSHHLPRKKKFKYIPIAVLEEQKKETDENSDDEPVDGNAEEQLMKNDVNDDKPDINDVPMEGCQGDEENQSAPARQDLNELDLSLGLTSLDEDHDPDSKMDTK